MTRGTEPSPSRGDVAVSAACAGCFGLGLGIGLVVIPLLALHAGYDETQIGLLIASSAVAQMVMRSFMGPLMRRWPDKAPIAAATLLVALSCGVLLVSTSLTAFLLAEIAQGTARAFFWTGLQTHIVRVARSAVGGFALVHIAGGVGSLAGPAVAGVLYEQGADLALLVGTAMGAVTLVPAVLLRRLPVFQTVRNEAGRVWRQPGVAAAGFAVLGTGTWKGALNSYIPVLLALAGHSAWLIGVLVAIANGAGLVGSACSARLRRLGARRSLLVGILLSGLGIAALGPAAGLVIAAGVTVVCAGFGAGTLETLAPVLATELVHPEQRGDVIATVGLFRAGALFATPTAMAGLVAFAPLSAAFVVVGGLVLLPVLGLRSIPRDA